jgi:predicted RNA-binding Zn-ribbon protein involved in translation (DUF1610 family)
MTALRGFTLNSHSYESDEGVAPAESESRSYHCPAGHVVILRFSVQAEDVPTTWDCPKCGRLAHEDEAAALALGASVAGRALVSPRSSVTGKTHWDMLRERRSLEDLEEILAERLELLRAASR